MDPRTAEFYSTHAKELARAYAGAEGGVSVHFPEAFHDRRRILDVGCGTGRDLLTLLRAGHDATGVDACESMVAATRQTCLEAGVNPDGRVFLASLPNLDLFPDPDEKQDTGFDGLLCSAVLMHLPESHMFDAVYAMRRVLKRGGRLLVSVPSRNDDVDPATRRDAKGRWFADLPPEKLSLLLERVGFRLEWEKTSPDSLGRESRTWTVMLFTRADEVTDRPLDTVESVLNRDKKDATYKLALFRALAEIAQSSYNLARFTNDSRVLVPIDAIAGKWLEYYWPIFEHESFIPQKQGETPRCGKPIAFRREMTQLIGRWRKQGGLPAFLAASRNETLSDETAGLHRRLMANLRKTIWNMPVRYAGGGKKGFSILQYDAARKTVVMSAAMWRELTLTGSWIQDATVLRWGELTSRLSKGAIKPSLVIDCLLAVAEPERETAAAREVYLALPGKHCVWSDQPIRDRFDVDHVIPFVLWRNNDLWNLLPVHPAINNEKRDRLPTRDALKWGADRILASWRAVRDRYPVRFDREAVGLSGGLDPANWENRLFGALTEAVEVTAVQRGVERWQPDRTPVLVKLRERLQSSALAYPPDWSKPMVVTKSAAPGPLPAAPAQPETAAQPRFHAYADVGDGAFRCYLPVVAALAAGEPFDGFETGSLDWVEECPWVAVPPRLAGRNRFVVRIAGDSMSPGLKIGDHVVFEYHRSPRTDREVVIANLTVFDADSSARTAGAVKRLTQDPETWIFRSDNPAYQDIRVSKAECQYPILGVLVGVLRRTSAESQA